MFACRVFLSGAQQASGLKARSVIGVATFVTRANAQQTSTVKKAKLSTSNGAPPSTPPPMEAASLSEQLMALLDRKSSVTAASKYNKRAIRAVEPEEEEEDDEEMDEDEMMMMEEEEDDEDDEYDEKYDLERRGEDDDDEFDVFDGDGAVDESPPPSFYNGTSYDQAVLAYLKAEWNQEFGHDFVPAHQTRKTMSIYGRHHWSSFSAFGADRTIYLPCVQLPPYNERWMLINLQKRLIGLFEQDLEETCVNGEYEWADTQIQVIANRAFAMGNIMFDVRRISQEWVLTLKTQLWPTNTGWLSQSSRFSSELLSRHRPELKILRPPRPPRTEPDLFRVKNIQIPYQRKKFVDRQNFDD